MPSTSEHITESHDNKTFENEQQMTTTNNDQNDTNNNRMKQRHLEFNDDASVAIMQASDGDKAERLAEIEMHTMDTLQLQRREQPLSIGTEGEIKQQHCGCIQIPIEHADCVEDDEKMAHDVSSLKKQLPDFLVLFFFFCFQYVFFLHFLCSFFYLLLLLLV